MLILDTTTKSIEILLGAAPATQLPWTASYADITSTDFVAAAAHGLTSGLAAVTMVAAPAASTQRQTKFLSVFNADVASQTVTIRLNDGGTFRIMAKVTLSPGEQLHYVDSHGFITLDSSGNIKTVQQVGGIPVGRTLTAGAGLTGGGDLSADRTFDVVANGDGSIVVNPNDIQVGVLASDAQHGVRGGGTQHSVATGAVAGFMSAADKTKLDGIAAGATSALLEWSNGSVSGTTTTRYMSPGYEGTLAPVSPVGIVLPFAGLLRNMRVRHTSPNGNGNQIVYTVRINGATTTIVTTLASTSVSGSDLAHSAAVAAGDVIDISVTKAASVGASPSDVVVTLELAAP